MDGEEKKTVKAYRCSHSGLYFPEEYVKMWGRVHGKGLGREPVSCVLDSAYHRRPGYHSGLNRSMHPVGVKRAQLDFVGEIPQEQFDANAVVLPTSPENRLKIHNIIMAKQAKRRPELARLTYEKAAKEIRQ